VAQHKNQETKTPDERAGLAEAERAETIAQLYLRKSKLSPEEAPLLREAFKDIFDEHFDLVWERVRRRVKDGQDAEELLQEAFLTLHSHILEHGFPDSIPGLLTKITDGKVSNYQRARMFALLDFGLPSSSSEVPRSGLDIDRVLDLQRLVRTILTQLSPEHQDVIEKVYLNGLSYDEAAEALGIPGGTLRSRLNAAKDALFALAEPLLPESQRGPR
jgi:RNA polymerase sigma-70 factor (ECF subfamily)